LNSFTYNPTTTDLSTENYIANITSDLLTAVTLDYNGTEYTMTNSGNLWSYTKVMQNLSGNKSIRLKYTYNGQNYYSDYYYQNITNVTFSLCDTSLTTKFLNLSYKYENGTVTQASLPSATIYYWLTNQSANKTYTYINTTENKTNYFCSSSPYSLNATYSIQYKNTASPQRIAQETLLLTNTTTNKTLYLLGSTEGIYVTYQVLSSVGDAISGVSVNATRTIDGETVIVGVGTTDSAGSITFWLNPDFLHTLTFAKTGYTTYTLNQFPTQSTYTVTLGTASGVDINDYIRGITYVVKPNFGTTLNVSKLHNFNMTFNSSYWTLDSFGFVIYGDGVEIGANSSTASSGFIFNNLNISSYDHISMKIYWIINGTEVYGKNNGWFTFNYEEGTDWSIWNLFKDFSDYADDGIFGLTQNAVNFIIFMLIFLFVGLASYKFSISSPSVIIGIAFALVFLFDVGLGLINVEVFGATVNNFPTIFIGLILVASVIWEARR